MTELKPCPFCGDPGVDVEATQEYDEYGFEIVDHRWYAQCRNPHCGARSGLFDERSYAITAWNTRAEEAK